MKLNVGSGQVAGSRFAEGWINVDFAWTPSGEEWKNAEYLKFDITGTWPIPRETADCVFMSHIMEHIEYGKLRKIFEECFRVLKTGHPVRIICPDPREFVRNWRIKNFQFIRDCYGDENIKRNGYESDYAKAFTDMFFSDNYDHLIAPSIDMAMVMLIRAGFSKMHEMHYRYTFFPEFFGSFEDSIDNRPVMSWYLEAVK